MSGDRPTRNHYLQRHHPVAPMPNPSDPPLAQIKFYLERYRIKEASNVFYTESTLKLLKEDPDFVWDLIPSICKRLRGLSPFRFRVFEGCEKMLYRICADESCNPKEILINLLSEITQNGNLTDDNVFKATIRSLESSIFKIESPTSREENLEWVLTILLKYFGELELPAERIDDEDIDKDRKIYTLYPKVRRFIELLPLILSFIEDFSNFNRPPSPNSNKLPDIADILADDGQEVEFDKDNLITPAEEAMVEQLAKLTCDTHSSSNCLADALLTLLQHPLTYLDCKPPSSDLHSIICRTVNLLFKVKPNFFSPIYTQLFDDKPNSKAYQTSDTHKLGLATAAYVYRCELLQNPDYVQYFPQVLDPECLLSCHLEYISLLLVQIEVLGHEKGLLLLDSLLKPLKDGCLGEKFFNCMIAKYTIHTDLFRLMVYSQSKNARTLALDSFIKLCDCMEANIKLKFLQQIIGKSDLRANVIGLCIDLYRQHLGSVFSEDVFKSSGGTEMLETIIGRCRNNVRHTEVIEDDDIQIACLSLLRFLKIRELVGPELATKLKTTFFEPTRSAIRLVITELHQHMDELKEMKEVEEKKKEQLKPSTSSAALATKQVTTCKENEESDSTDDSEDFETNTNETATKNFMLDRILDSKYSATDMKDVPRRKESECLDWILCRANLVESILIRTCELYDS